MANFLFIGRVLNDNGDANTQCALRLSEGLAGRGHRSFFVADELYGSGSGEPKERLSKLRIRCKKIHQSINVKLAAHSRNSLPGTFWYIAAVFITCLEAWLYMRQMASKGRKIIRREKIDYIVSMFQDIDNHNAAYKLTGRRRRPKWIMYNLDQISFSSMNTEEQRENLKKLETSFAKRVYKIINSEGMEEEYVRNNFTPYSNVPRIEVPLPNLKPHTGSAAVRQDGRMILRYFGRFYKDIRNPDLLIQMVSDLDPQKYSVEFYGSCCKYLQDNYDKLPPCVRLMGTVDHDECLRLTEDADVLINLGNTCANQMPSKVFEYIGSGKPILNFYFNELECSMKYLLRYPCILNVRYDQTLSGGELDQFCRTARQIPEEEIREIYSDVLSECVLQKISDFIER